MNKRLMCLCDGDSNIGFGHVGRCISIAEEFKKHSWDVMFAGSFADGAEELIIEAGFSITKRTDRNGDENVSGTIEDCRKTNTNCILIDSYNVREEYLAKLHALFFVVFIDDYGVLKTYPCSLILHPLLNDREVVFPQQAVVLSGAEYIPVRQEYIAKKNQYAYKSKLENILITLGGSIQTESLIRILEAIVRINRSLNVCVLAGRNNQHNISLMKCLSLLNEKSRLKAQLPSLADEMIQSDLIICGGGMTKYEAIFLGVPCVTVSVNASQVNENNYFSEKEYTYNLGEIGSVSDESIYHSLGILFSDEKLRRELHEHVRDLFPPNPNHNIYNKITEKIDNQ